ncbi:MAG: exodeoxyribonuclease VII large subunit [Pseudobdellovibrionaceae bacterium]|jgi:exodeoxyribonuclease VII large subunit|nr:exodeoxyribonuclease VII large subunit [Pseudobdellovibrionaceae bacterium]
MDDFSDFNSSGSARSNVPELSVSELALSLKRTLEDTYGRVRVRGELSRVKIHSSGHVYSDLKDADAVLNIVCWRGNVARLSIRPEEGLDVVCTGKITSYPARSNYQMVVETMELAGEGALLKMLEDRRKRLAAEGLFDESRKKCRPFLPEVIGVITSPTGAVIRDILHRLEDRFPRRVLLWPVNVQGDTAAEEITLAIRGMNSLDGSNPSLPRPDLLIVARGGGSLEDLMPFNEESVVRAAADSAIPLISAVGHETDTTLIDYAADLRAPTPTAAAEMAVPERVLLQNGLHEASTRLSGLLQALVKTFVQHLGHLSARLGEPDRFFDIREQKLDHVSDRLAHALGDMIYRKDQVFGRLSGRLPHPRQRLDLAQNGFSHADQGLKRAGDGLFQDAVLKLSHVSKMLELLSFKSVLGRGFAVIRDEEGKPLTRAEEILAQDRVTIEMQDGSLKTIVEEKL